MSLINQELSCNCTNKHDDVIQFLTNIVDETCKFKDRYFDTHNISEAADKNKNIENLVNKNLQLFNEHETIGLATNKAYYNFLKGKLLNILPTYLIDAEMLLSKAIKLDPKLVDAWNDLGECYCKKEDFVQAKSCFEAALKQKRNKVSLRNLSILLRTEKSKSDQDRVESIKKGLTYAKEAINLDPDDGLSWTVLGNAYLFNFFEAYKEPSFLKQCLVAYNRAEKDSIAKTTSELHYNKGILFSYQQEFKLSLESFNQACMYEPSWDIPQIKKNELFKYLENIQDLVDTKGKIKPKKCQQILQSINSKQLGPFAGGSYTSSKGDTVKLTEVSYNSLKEGLNEEAVILGKVICSIRNEVPFTFCSIDKEGSVIVTTIFNLTNGKGVIIGDSVAIPDPHVTDIDFTYEEKKFKFRLVRVDTPVIMVVNSRKLTAEYQADVKLSISKKFN